MSFVKKTAGFLAATVVVTVAVSSLSACATQPQPVASSTVAANDILTMTLPADVTASGVITAAVLLRAGSIEEAVSNGTVTPAEVDLARQAMTDGLLDLWAQRAEASLK